MADYDRRLRQLESRVEGDKEMREASRQRLRELLSPEEIARGAPSSYDPEWKATWEALVAKVSAEGKR